MANKYSEELFGAVDTIVKKRLQELSKDTTILCSIEDTSEAADGKYVVVNNALRFDAYSEKTDYKEGQNVWVLVPDGDYNNTKIIVGKYVSTDTESFTWVDPFKNFADMTGNLAINYNDRKYELVANGLLEEIAIPIISANDDLYINGKTGTNIVNGLKGLDRIAVSADFATLFPANTILSGDYGLRIELTTDKELDIGPIYLNTKAMSGVLYGQNGQWVEQKIVYDFDPDKVGNITSITCYFYQGKDFLTKDGKYNLDKNNDIINNSPDIMMQNLKIMMGYSTNKLKDSTALLSSFGSMYFTIESGDNERVLVPRFAYNNGDGTFTFINSYEDYIKSDLRDLKLHLYYHDPTQTYVEPRILLRSYRESWERELQDSLSNWDKWETCTSFIQNFEIPIIFDNPNIKEEIVRVAFTYKRSSTQLTNIETLFNNIIEHLNKVYFSKDNLKIKFEPYENDLDVIQIILLHLNKWFETKKDIAVNFLFYDEENDITEEYLPSEYNDYYYTDFENTVSEKERFFWNCIIALICQTYENLEKLDYIKFLEDDEWVEFFGTKINKNENDEITSIEYAEHNENYHAFAKYLIYKIITTFNYVRNDIFRNFEKAKNVLENVVLSDPLYFENTASDIDNIMDSLVGLQLETTDSQNGIYNLYKASTNANSELIKPSDANIKRNIELSFSSSVLGSDDLAAANLIYWLIPRSGSMIKEPIPNINFGQNIWAPLRYDTQSFSEWSDKYIYSTNPEERGMSLYYKNSSSTYQEITYRDKIYYLNDQSSGYTSAETFLSSLGFDRAQGYITLYAKVNLFLIVNSIEDLDDLPEGATMYNKDTGIGNCFLKIQDDPNHPTGYCGLWDYLVNKYSDETIELGLKERKFISDYLNNNYWLIVEDRFGTSLINGNLQRASMSYQIKSVFRKTFTNNKIYAAIFRNTEKYSNSKELYFGVKGTNDANYTLTITPIKEVYGSTNEIEMTPNVWTKNSTKSMQFRAMVYDNDDKPITDKFNIEFSIYKGKHDNFKNIAERAEDEAVNERTLQLRDDLMNNPINTINWNGYGGIIIKCVATPSTQATDQIAITQYYILPMRNDRKYVYLNGPDIVTYDANKINPTYNNVAYTLRDENYNEIATGSGKVRELYREKVDNTNTHDEFLPKISEGYLIPTLSYIDNEGYDFYIRVLEGIKVDDQLTSIEELWCQPILITLNNYTNSLVNDISEGKGVRKTNNNNTASSVMTVLKREDAGNGKQELTGIIIGSLPTITVNDVQKERNGILGYLRDVEKYAFLDNGNAFIKGSGITINTENGLSNVDDSVIQYTVNRNKNKVLAGPVSGDDSPATFRVLNEADIPELSAEKITGLTTLMGSFNTHVHGNITNDGKIANANNVEIENNDRLIISDSSDSYLLKNSSITFDGSTATKALTQKGTWETFNNYSHPTTSATAAAAVKIGKDELGHVVIGNALTKGDIGLGSVENTALSTWTGSSNISTVGTLSAGTVPWARLSNIPSASTSASGIVQLTDAVNSTSTNTAATANAVKNAYDVGNTALSGVNGITSWLNLDLDDQEQAAFYEMVGSAIKTLIEYGTFIRINGTDYMFKQVTINGETVYVLGTTS